MQDTWLAVVHGVDRFEGRSSFKTWLFHILLNRARTTAGREHRTAALPDGDLDDRFDETGAWAAPPVPWSDQVEDRMVADRLARRVREILPTLPDVQRQVVVLRDIEGIAQPMSASCSASPMAISACCCTEGGHGSESSSKRRWRRHEDAVPASTSSTRVPSSRRAHGRLPRRCADCPCGIAEASSLNT